MYDHKIFDTENFNTTLQASLDTVISNTYSEYEKAFLNVLNKHAHLKMKMLRHNNNVFMTKNLKKEIMTRTKLKNKFNKNRSMKTGIVISFRDFCVNL